MEPVQTFGRRGLQAEAVFATWTPPATWESAPTVDEAEAEARQPLPYLTCAILLVLTLIFVAEQASGFGVGADLALGMPALKALGGGGLDLVLRHGEWWRVITAPLLHASASHLIGNGVVLLFAGVTLERLVGRAWLGAIFVASALGGEAASLLLNAPEIVGVGASGAIMGLLAAVLACSLHFAAHDQAHRLRWVGFRLLIPALIPFDAISGAATDYNAHMGGAAAGGLAAFILLTVWPENGAPPGLKKVAAGIGVAGVIAAVVALISAAFSYPTYAARALALIPNIDVPTKGPEAEANTLDLVQRYPHDPRAHLFRASYLEGRSELVAADHEVGLGLAEREALARDMPPGVTYGLQLQHVVILLKQNRHAEAAAAAQPLCAVKTVDARMAKAQKALRKAKMCAAEGAAASP
jgi:rhomboid protease GluP